MRKLTTLTFLALIALFQSCATAERSIAQEKKNTFEEKKHHYPALRRVERY